MTTHHDWRDRAACAGRDTNIFYAHEQALHRKYRADLAAEAFALCARCPVRQSCLDDALTALSQDQHGIRGGTYAVTRKAMKQAHIDHDKDTA